MTLNPPPSATEQTLDTSRMQKWVGNGDGPIQASWPPLEYTNSAQQVAPKVAATLGLRSEGVALGESVGYYDQALSIDMKAGRRSSAVYEYYQPIADRPNLFLITDAMVQRVMFSGTNKDGDQIATGVEFASKNQKHSVSAKKEVILCAGTIQSPQLLELSGIGSKAILEKHGIDVLVDNPGVGENLQDHVMSGLSYEAGTEVLTLEDLKQPGVMESLIQDYTKAPVGPLVNQLTSSFYLSYQDVLSDPSKLKERVADLVPDTQTSGNGSLAKQMKQHRDRLLSSKDCAVWIVPFPGGSNFKNVTNGAGMFEHTNTGRYFGAAACLTHPLSRGSSHIQSSDVNVHPIMDPRYMSHPADVAVMTEGLRYIDSTLVTSKPFMSILKDGTKTLQPLYSSFTLDTAEDHAQEFLCTQWHILGTCSMLPKEDGGVVDPTLKVYGTANLRVVDASIIPLEPQGNIQTAVYAIAEKGADLVKATW